MGLFGDIGGGLGGIAGGIGSLFSAGGEREAGKYYGEAAAITKQETGLKLLAATRNIYQTLGTAKSDIGASGLANSGSAALSLRSSVQQGGITKAIIGEQGKIEEDSYLAQQQSAEAAAKAQEASGFGDILSGGLGIIGAFI